MTGSALTLIAALTSLGLMGVLGARTFASALMGVFTAALFLLTPLLWQQLQSGSPAVYPLPFVAGWLVTIAFFADTRDRRWLVAAGVMLAAGLYASRAAMVMMPLYVLLTALVLACTGLRSIRSLAAFLAVFIVGALPLLASFVLFPQRFRDIVLGAHLYDANRFNVLQGIREMASWVGLTARSEVYFKYFDPAFLFFSGEVLAFPLIVLLPFGLYRMLDETTIPARVVLGGFLLAPFAAALTAEDVTPARILFLIPCAAMASVYGARALWAGAVRLMTHAGLRQQRSSPS
jgi:hypothetical protein